MVTNGETTGAQQAFLKGGAFNRSVVCTTLIQLIKAILCVLLQILAFLKHSRGRHVSTIPYIWKLYYCKVPGGSVAYWSTRRIRESGSRQLVKPSQKKCAPLTFYQTYETRSDTVDIFLAAVVRLKTCQDKELPCFVPGPLLVGP